MKSFIAKIKNSKFGKLVYRIYKLIRSVVNIEIKDELLVEKIKSLPYYNRLTMDVRYYKKLANVILTKGGLTIRYLCKLKEEAIENINDEECPEMCKKASEIYLKNFNYVEEFIIEKATDKTITCKALKKYIKSIKDKFE